MADLDYVPAKVPQAGGICVTILQMVTLVVLSFCLTRRTQWITNWDSLPLAQWIILLIYVVSTMFVFGTAILLHGLGVNSSPAVCETGIFLCLLLYMATKIFTYYFLVERAYIVGGSRKPRMKTKLWLFNCLFMILPYTIVAVINFIYRINYINSKGVCIIGMEKIAMMPLIVFEAIVNIYLTLLFIVPLRGLHSYQTNANPLLKRMAWRSFVGSCATLTTSVTNLTILMVLKGEPAWICFTICNADILFCISVLHWVTSKERNGEEGSVTRSTGMSKGGIRSTRAGNPMTIGSQTTRSNRMSTIVDDHEKDGPIKFTVTSPEGKSVSGNRGPATITTECVAGSGRHLGGSSWDAVDARAGVREDEVELNNIHVHTIQTREVEIDGDIERKTSGSSSTVGELDDAWVASRRGVVVERLV